MSEMSPAEEVFFAALEKSPAERVPYLDEACAGQPELRARVDKLLAAHPRVGEFLEAGEGATRTHLGDVPTRSLPPLATAGTEVAGRYKLLQAIGAGGMGSVWMADQTEPVKRRVAVKLIRAEKGNSKTILSRFEAERQAIALMDHPNIAKLLDAGTTEDGQPFFVMELVKGVPLNDYCDTHKLPIDERLNLFVQICGAVQHAHQKGIIHRDLKPTNILVESHDGKPVPKVIDFGLAKATSGMQLSDHTLFTGFGTVMGTPLYMAPEQATFNAVDVDTRADIFALGVILYELLTGTTPLSRESVKKAALEEMLKLIREQEAPTPSSRLSSSESAPSVAANRQMEPAKLGRFVKGELDWIVLKALAKERDRRYETANGFARDIERFLNHEPVTAGPPTAAYRVRKFVRRNRGQVIGAGAVLLALFAGFIATSYGFYRAELQRQRAETAERNAVENALKALDAAEAEKQAKLDAQTKEAEANAVVKFFEDKVFAAGRPKGEGGGLGHEVSLRDAIRASLPALGSRFVAQPLVELRLRATLGSTFQYLGDSAQAADQFEQALVLSIRHRGSDHPNSLVCMNNLANCYFLLDRHAEALKLREETLAAHRRVLPPDHPSTLKSMGNLANSYTVANRLADALKLREETLAGQKRVLPPDHPDTLQSMHNLAHIHAALNHHAIAIQLREETLAIRKRVLPVDHPDTLMSKMGLANSYAALNRHTEALKLREETLAAQRRVLPPDHPLTLQSMMSLASSYADMNRPAEAVKLYEETLAVQKRVLPPDHTSTLKTMSNLASCYAILNRPTEALKLREATLAAQMRVLSSDHPDTLTSMNNLANSYAALNRNAEALKLREETLAAQKRVLPPDHPDTLRSMTNLASSYADLNRPTEALSLLDEVLAKHDRPGLPPVQVLRAIQGRMQCCQKLGDLAGCRATVEMCEKRNPTNAVDLYTAAYCRAVTASLQAKAKDPNAARLAKEDADKAMAWLQKAVAAGWKDTAHMKKDADLDSLRDREDFRKLLADLEAIVPRQAEGAPMPRAAK